MGLNVIREDSVRSLRLKSLGIDPQARPETLPPALFQQLAEAFGSLDG